MLGFTLSKLNLLILVTALFAIIAFFMFTLADIMISHQAQLMVKDAIESVHGLMSQQITCRKSSITIPSAIEYYGGFSPTERFYYVMYIKRFPEQPVQGEPNLVIFQIASRKERDKLIATSSIMVDAEIFLYDWDVQSGVFSEQPQITLDPESPGVSTKNSLILIKEQYLGKNYLHLIACSSAPGVCESHVGKASCWLKVCSGQNRESTCFPKPEDCATKITCGAAP
jgi:hypothetical protein